MRFESFIENKYNQLLMALIIVFIGSPFLPDRGMGSFLLFSYLLTSLTLVIHKIQRSKQALNIHVSLVLLALLLRGIYDSDLKWLPFKWLLAISSTIILLFLLALSIYLILNELFASEKVNSDTMKGGVCTYFLIGFFFAYGYSIIFLLNPAAFKVVTPVQEFSDLVYFSFTTLTSTGYGDILPNSPIAKVGANLESIVGIMYPAVFIARLVSLYNK